MRRALDAIAAYMIDNPTASAIISGHADNEGDDRDNLALSRKRADYAKWYVVDRGVERYRIETVGYGSTHPLRSNGNDSGRAANRRIEIELAP